MDQTTRIFLQRATQDARRLLETEFATQLEGTFDILPDGTILPEAGAHLDERQRLTRKKIVEAIEHIRVKDSNKTKAQAVGDYLREAAFTFLNRFAALRMLESRGLVQQCVSKGDQSSGFKEFTGLAPGLGSLPDKGYQLYLECLFDEMATEIKVLFDRRDSASLLWPRRQALLNLLDILNRPALQGIWGEAETDETIGWIYQYYNDEAERKKMREESSAPRNSRELAVRNQFFTPRYVVEFLTDNTLGRIWYEMTRGETALRDRCRYLVRRPTEIFLNPGESVPESSTNGEMQFGENLSQDELLRQPVHIPHRPLKDPREIRLLDPACGSMHFGLYAFNLFTVIYDEAWEIVHGPSDEAKSAETFAPFVTFAATFRDKAAFLREVPRLIVEYNIHGIDIDPRAAQIAGLSLWLRAQRAWQQAVIKPVDRPRIRRSNVVCAQPMPGEKELLREFVERQFSAGERPAFAFLMEKIFDRMKLAGEAGSLLRIEEEIRAAIAEARALAQSQSAPRQTRLFPGDERPEQAGFDLRGLNDEQFWQKAEQRIYAALEAYAEQAEDGGGFQRRLFADDAAEGFAFIDLCRKRYEVAVMNPPFGECSELSRDYIQKRFPSTYKNVFASFIERMLKLVATGGRIGAVTSRTFLFLPDFEYLRDSCLEAGERLSCCAELGDGVLDNATVRIAATVITNESSFAPVLFARVNDVAIDVKGTALLEAVQKISDGKRDDMCFLVTPRIFRQLPGKVFAYTTAEYLLRLFSNFQRLQPKYAWARRVPGTGENDAALRLRFEVPATQLAPLGPWCSYAKGGAFSPFYGDCDLVIWVPSFADICDPQRTGGVGLTEKPLNTDLFGAPSLTFSYANDFGLDVRPLRGGSLFDSGGPIIFPVNFEQRWWLLGLLNSRIIRRILFVLTPERFKQVGLVQSIPISTECSEELAHNSKAVVSAKARNQAYEETSPQFFRPLFIAPTGLRESIGKTVQERLQIEAEMWHAFDKLDRYAFLAYGLSEEQREHVIKEIGAIPTEYSDNGETPDLNRVDFTVRGRDVGKGKLTCSYQNTGSLERICHISLRTPGSILSNCETVSALARIQERSYIDNLLSWALGIAFGRWTILSASAEVPHVEAERLFEMLPICPPGMLQGDDGLPLSPEVGRRLRAEGSYPLDVAWDGILVDDPEHPLDLERSVHAAFAVLWDDRAEALEHEACELLGVPTLREWFRRPAGFFADHLKRYSKSRRQAPIYWPLSTSTGSYSVWLYYHRMRRDTLALALAHAKEKLRYEQRKLEALRVDSGPNPTRSQREELEAQGTVVGEITGFLEELSRVAPLWNPNLNDGVIINYAPLWRMVGHTPWRKSVKECWDALVAGDYDWAHLAMHLWPERVIPKCRDDASLAIAHGLDDIFWDRGDRVRLITKTPPEGGWEPVIGRLIAERSSVAVKAALQSLLDAPPLAGARGGRRGTGRVSAPRRTPRVIAQPDAEVLPRSTRTRTVSSPVDAETLNLIKDTIGAATQGASKADVLASTGLAEARWNSAISQLLEQGIITRTGERRGTRYHLAERHLSNPSDMTDETTLEGQT